MEKLPTKDRQSNFELLRIICMMLIVALHYYEYGFIISDTQPVTSNYLLLRFIGFGGHMAVDIFVLISGYFMVMQSFSGKKALKLCMQTAFFALAFASAYYIKGEAGIRDIFDAVFAPVNNLYWFITCYFLLYILSGYINKLIFSVTRSSLLALIAVLVAVCSALPTFLGIRAESSNLLLFIMLYLIAAYIRLYSPKLLESRYCLIAGIAFHWLCFAASAAMFAMKDTYPILEQISNRMTLVQDFTVLLSAILVFAGFNNLKIGNSKVINKIAGSSVGVYLLHNNPFGNHLIWVDIFHTPDYFDSSSLAIHAVIAIASVCVGCTLIDMLYRRIIEKPVMAFVDKHWDGWREAFTHTFRKFSPEE